MCALKIDLSAILGYILHHSICTQKWQLSPHFHRKPTAQAQFSTKSTAHEQLLSPVVKRYLSSHYSRIISHLAKSQLPEMGFLGTFSPLFKHLASDVVTR
jgi:hypothetical protein